MATQLHSQTCTSEAKFKRRHDVNKSIHAPLIQSGKIETASAWTTRHLVHCRVIFHEAKDAYHPRTLLPYYENLDWSSRMFPLLKSFIDGPPDGYLRKTEQLLVEENDIVGYVWSALADLRKQARVDVMNFNSTVLRPPIDDDSPMGIDDHREPPRPADPVKKGVKQAVPDSDTKDGNNKDSTSGMTPEMSRLDFDTPGPSTPPNPKRTRQHPTRTKHEGYEDSGEKISPGSASPSSTSSSSQFTLGDQIDGNEFPSWTPLELSTVRMVSYAMRHVLHMIERHTRKNHEGCAAEYRYHEIQLAALFGDKNRAKHNSFRAKDDGGMCIRKTFLNEEELTVVNNHVAVLEAKAAFCSLKDKAGSPLISDEVLGQMTCEAILARKEVDQVEMEERDREALDTIFIIHSVRHYVRIFQFQINERYIRKFPNLAEDQFINVTPTGWMNLNLKDGRYWFAANIYGILRHGYHIHGIEP